jgi:magnesium-protoporphyrin IX monomethyl ester (oxidative) cyclase
VYPVRFDRYSPYFVQAEAYDLDLRPYDFYALIYPFSKEVLANLAYYFMDNNLTAEYVIAMARWIDKVREQVKMWRNRWAGDLRVVPQLVFKKKGKSTIVYDSRAGEAIEHEIGDVGVEVLKKLAGPKRLANIASDLSHIPNLDAEKEVGSLQERGLIFQEADRFMSLVLEEQLFLNAECRM